jgi:hypothetical protein
VGAALALCAIAGVGYGLLTTLPAPSRGDRIAVRVLARLQVTRGRGATLEVEGKTQRLTCRRLGGGRHLLALGDGTQLVLAGTHVHETREPLRLRMLASLRRDPALTAAEADLSGSHALYATQLAGQLAHGRAALVGSTVVGGRPAYRLRLTRGRPQLELLVSRRSLTPLVAVYRSAAVDGWSVLGPSTTRYRWRAC